MDKVTIVIEGVAPLLQHRFPMEDNPETKSARKKQEYDAQKDCEKALYVDEKGIICQPATHILGSMIKAGTEFTYKGKKTYKEIIKSCVFIDQFLIPHLNQKWKIDRQAVVISRARIIRARPRFDKWKLKFTISFDNSVINSVTLKEILDCAGLRIGIGDYRPVYGRFTVVEFK